MLVAKELSCHNVLVLCNQVLVPVIDVFEENYGCRLTNKGAAKVARTNVTRYEHLSRQRQQEIVSITPQILRHYLLAAESKEFPLPERASY